MKTYTINGGPLQPSKITTKLKMNDYMQSLVTSATILRARSAKTSSVAILVKNLS